MPICVQTHESTRTAIDAEMTARVETIQSAGADSL